MLGGCNFNEDFCIREGELVAWCDFSGIKESRLSPRKDTSSLSERMCRIPKEQRSHRITLRWSLPQGAYRFLFYTGNYELPGQEYYHETRHAAGPD